MATYEMSRWMPFDDPFMRAFFGREMWPMRTMEHMNLAVDVFQKDGKMYVKATIPGMEVKDIKVSVADDMLTIEGEHKAEKEVKENDYFIRERTMGSFHRSLRLPPNVKAGEAKATFDKGVLTIEMPMTMATRTQPVEVKVEPRM